MAAPWVDLGLTLLLSSLGVALISGGERVFGALFVLGALGFAGLAMLGLRGESAERDFEEERLREELLATLEGHRRQ